MSRLTASERKQIILDHLQGIPNNLYEVKELSNGTYRVSKINKEPSPPSSCSTEEIEQKSPSPPQKPKRNIITNEDIMNKITELYEMQNRVPQNHSSIGGEDDRPRPPIDSTIEEETIKEFRTPQKSLMSRRKLILH